MDERYMVLVADTVVDTLVSKEAAKRLVVESLENYPQEDITVYEVKLVDFEVKTVVFADD